MSEELKKEQNGSETASTGCGMFDFLKKKENDNVPSGDEARYSRGDSSSSSSDEEGNNGEKKKKKGLKDKIKDKISAKKEGENTEPSEKTSGVGGEAMHSEEKGFIDKIKDKLPGHGQSKKADEHCNDDGAQDKKGIFDKIKEKLPVGHNNKDDDQKPKEN